MNNKIIEVNPQEEHFLSMAEAANKLGITPNALRKWLKKNVKKESPSFCKRKYTCSISGQNQNMLVIEDKMLLAVSKYKGFPASNQHVKKGAAPILKNNKISISQQVMTDMANLMKELTQELRTLRQERIKLPTLQQNNPYRSITQQERDELTSMCKAIIFKKLNVELGDTYDRNEFEREIIALRRDMNFHLGRSKVGDYTQKDFEQAKEWLKQYES